MFKYNSVDDYIRLGMLEKTDLANHYFNLEEAVDFLALPNNRFPLWIKVIFKETLNETLVFELKTSMRYRTPTQLKYIETGHPPFIFEKKDND